MTLHPANGPFWMCALSAAALMLTFTLPSSAAEDRPPRFADYPVKRMYKGKTAKPVLRSEYLRDRRELFPDRDEKPNFAGRYHVVKMTCGSSCVTGVIMDAPTGRIREDLFTVCCWREVFDDFEAIDFRPDSRLIVFLGGRNEKPGDHGYHYYLWEGNKLRFLRTIKSDGDFLKPPEQAEPGNN